MGGYPTLAHGTVFGEWSESANYAACGLAIFRPGQVHVPRRLQASEPFARPAAGLPALGPAAVGSGDPPLLPVPAQDLPGAVAGHAHGRERHGRGPELRRTERRAVAV